MFEIEKGIPIPEQKSIYPIKDMKIGDSFIIPAGRNKYNPSPLISPQAKRYGIKLTTRKLSNGDYRVWRVE